MSGNDLFNPLLTLESGAEVCNRFNLEMERIVNIYTDGACEPNPGYGGWAAILVYRGIVKELSGSAVNVTNNIMEMMGPIMGLSALKKRCTVTVTSDSQYVVNGITSWIHGWRRNGWLTKAGKDVLNRELWKELYRLTQLHQVKFEWVRGHNGHEYNELADQLAVRARRRAVFDEKK